MSDDSFEIFIKAQIKAIEIAKWIEGEKRKQDPSQEYMHEWIKNNARLFKEAWQRSMCKNCKNDCRYNNKSDCINFLPSN